MSYSPTSSSSSDAAAAAAAAAASPSDAASAERDRQRLLRLVQRFGKVRLELECRLGQAEMKLRHLLGLRPGSIVALDRTAGEDLEVSINGCALGRAEVLVADGRVLLRIVELDDD